MKDFPDTMVPAIRPTQAGRSMTAGATLVVDCPTGTYRLLNGAGGRLWELIDGRRSVADLAGSLAGEYGISTEQALADTRAFLADAIGRGMLEAASAT